MNLLDKPRRINPLDKPQKKESSGQAQKNKNSDKPRKNESSGQARKVYPSGFFRSNPKVLILSFVLSTEPFSMKRLSTIALVALASSLWATEPPDKKAENFMATHLYAGLPECDEPCPGDFDDSGHVGDDDLLMLLGVYGTEQEGGCAVGDFDEDGLITILDLKSWLPFFGFPCP